MRISVDMSDCPCSIHSDCNSNISFRVISKITKRKAWSLGDLFEFQCCTKDSLSAEQCSLKRVMYTFRRVKPVRLVFGKPSDSLGEPFGARAPICLSDVPFFLHLLGYFLSCLDLGDFA